MQFSSLRLGVAVVNYHVPPGPMQKALRQLQAASPCSPDNGERVDTLGPDAGLVSFTMTCLGYSVMANDARRQSFLLPISASLLAGARNSDLSHSLAADGETCL